MLNWYRTHRIVAAGALACLLFGGIEVAGFVLDGMSKLEMFMPAAVVAQHIAAQFTDAPSLVRAGSDRARLTYQIIVGWQSFITLSFAVLLWLRPRWRRHRRIDAAVLALQMVAAALSLSALVYVLAAEIAVIKPLREGVKWLATQMTLVALMLAYMVFAQVDRLGDNNIKLIFMFGFFGLVFQAIAFGMAQVAMRERHGRLALAASNARLLATQSMLGDTVRAMERIRIARDLHDAVGHHLTALNLHLDLALRQADSAAPPSLHTSRDLARSLLAEVRSVIHSERSERNERSDHLINLRAAIATMCSGIPSPRTELAFDERLDIASPMLANTLFYCVQEAVTNAARHARAETLTIDIRQRDGAIVLTLADDGCGAANAPEGNGLRGMRERVAEQGGTLRLTEAGPGFGLVIALPMTAGAA